MNRFLLFFKISDNLPEKHKNVIETHVRTKIFDLSTFWPDFSLNFVGKFYQLILISVLSSFNFFLNGKMTALL